ncbi:MAG TPA: hypothetical protein VE396_15840 [Xanthobacteraceae bacterium]|jgi:hypothetical protein|nr:hypothetical protein [Xanthobacteraceae bacterium]
MSPELLFWYGLALKMVLTAIVVVITSVAVERVGPVIGALIAALPTAAGAAYVILAIEHPPSFIAASAIGSVATGAAVSIFSAIYIILAQRRGMLFSLSVSLAIWFMVTAVFRLVAWTPLSAVALNVVVFGITIPLSWRYRASGPPKKFLRTSHDIPLRAIAAGTVVAIVTTASYRIGSVASGMFALFPIILCSSIVILHPRVGGKATASMLAHAQIAFVGLSLSFLAVHYTAEPLGSWWAFAIGLSVCMIWSGILLLARLRTTKRATQKAIASARAAS